MFIVCSNCEFKYLVNSADLKPNGRMVECANCNHQWFQELDDTDITSSVPSTKKEELDQNLKNNKPKRKIRKRSSQKFTKYSCKTRKTKCY